MVFYKVNNNDMDFIDDEEQNESSHNHLEEEKQKIDDEIHKLEKQLNKLKKKRNKLDQQISEQNKAPNKIDTTKNIPTHNLEALIPEHIVNNIMNFHGGINSKIPYDTAMQYKKYINKDNWRIENKRLIIDVKRNMIDDIINDNILIDYCYPFNSGNIQTDGYIESFKNNCVVFKNEDPYGRGINGYSLNFNKFIYIQIITPIKQNKKKKDSTP